MKSGILDAEANWATLEVRPVIPQSYCWIVGRILKTGVVEDMVRAIYEVVGGGKGSLWLQGHRGHYVEWNAGG